MLTKQEASRRLREAFPQLSQRYGLKRIGLFGSVVKGNQSDDSDVDIVAEFSRPIGLEFVEFAAELEEILESSADVLTPSGIASIRNRAVCESITSSVEYVEPI